MSKKEISKNLNGCLKCLFKTIHPCFALLVTPTPEDVTRSILHCALSPDISTNYSGCYFENLKVKRLSTNALNTQDAVKLWEISEKLVNL